MVERVAGASDRVPRPLLVGGAGLVVVLLAVLLVAILQATKGRNVYLLDDAFIHLAVGRTLAEHGVWGLGPDAFAFASSSPVWTLALAGAHLVWPSALYAPLVVNVLLAVGLPAIGWGLARRLGADPLGAVVAIAAMFWATGIAGLVFTGMEHVAHVAVTLAQALALVRVLHGDRRDPAGVAWLLGLTALSVGLRFEGLFVAAAVGLVCMARRRVRLGVATWVVAWLPVAAYAWYATLRGGQWLPNSIVVKSQPIALVDPSLALGERLAWFGRWAGGLVDVPTLGLLWLVGVGLLVAGRRDAARGPVGSVLWVFVGATVLHLQLANTGWFYRYESYLVALGAVTVVSGLATLGRPLLAPGAANERPSLPRMVTAAMVAALAMFIVARGFFVVTTTPQAAREIRLHHLTMVDFLDQHDEWSAVALTDIGAVSYLTDARVVDILGLGDNVMADAMADGQWNAATVARRSDDLGAEIAIVYPETFGGVIPEDWELVGTWTAPARVVATDEVIGLYAVRPSAAARLRDSLVAFEDDLDPAVRLDLR